MIGHLGFICCPPTGVGPQNPSLYNHTLAARDHGLCYTHECSLLPAWLISFSGNGLLFQQTDATSRDPGRVLFLSACLLRVFMLILKSLHWGQDFYVLFIMYPKQMKQTLYILGTQKYLLEVELSKWNLNIFSFDTTNDLLWLFIIY